METPELSSANSPIGAIPPTGEGPVGLVCNEVWGGNRIFYGPIELPGMRGVLFSQPCDGALGGDVHYLSVCGSGLISRACIADVTGHGESVSAASDAMHDLLRKSMNRIDERKVLRRMNLRLAEIEAGTFTTAAALTYVPPTRRLSIGYAGHEPAYYYDSSTDSWSQLELARRKGLFDVVLAVDRRTRYTRHVRRVANGDRLLMITDGVLEAPSKTGALFGREGLFDVLRASGDRTPQELVDRIIERLSEHTNGAPLVHDDVSILMLQFVDNLKSSALWTALRNRIWGRSGKNHAF